MYKHPRFFVWRLLEGAPARRSRLLEDTMLILEPNGTLERKPRPRRSLLQWLVRLWPRGNWWS